VFIVATNSREMRDSVFPLTLSFPMALSRRFLFRRVRNGWTLAVREEFCPLHRIKLHL